MPEEKLRSLRGGIDDPSYTIKFFIPLQAKNCDENRQFFRLTNLHIEVVDTGHNQSRLVIKRKVRKLVKR